MHIPYEKPWSKTPSVFTGGENRLSPGRVRLLPSDPGDPCEAGPDSAALACSAAIRGKSPTEQGLGGGGGGSNLIALKNPTAQKEQEARPFQGRPLPEPPSPPPGSPRRLPELPPSPSWEPGGKGTLSCK